MELQPDLKVDIGGVPLKNPVMTASGTFGYAKEFAPLIDLRQLGGIVVKGLSLEPAKGNPPPRIFETASGMLNAIGLENVGLNCFIEEKLPFLETLQTPVIANIYGKTEQEYAELARRVGAVETISALEVNISCPNVKQGGVAFGADGDSAAAVVTAVRKATQKPVIVKLSPNVSDIVQIARQVEDAGADGLSLINTITGMAIDIHTRKPRLANITGGLSGPAIKPIAVRMVWQTSQAVSIPIIGIGGIMTAEDALEFMIAGATAIQVGTANFVNPQAPLEIITGIEAFMQKHRIRKITDLVNTLQL